MDEKRFIESYLRPSEAMLDRSYTHPLPPIPGLEKGSEFIVQGRKGDTFSTNVIYSYESKGAGIKMIDVYKCSQHLKDGQFVRLVGTMRLVKPGYPIVFLDAAVTNMSPFTQQREPVTTRVLIHAPQAMEAQRNAVFELLKGRAEKAGATQKQVTNPNMPGFWGPIWLAESKKLDLPLIESLRNGTAESYLAMTEASGPDKAIDYKAVKDHMIYKTSQGEHVTFGKMGLEVDLEAQAAFFSVMTTGAQNPA